MKSSYIYFQPSLQAPKLRLLFFLLFFTPFSAIHSQLSEPFNNDNGFTKSADGFFSDGGGDYWGIYDPLGTNHDFDGGTNPTGIAGFTGFGGIFLVGEDFDGDGNSGTQTLTWTVNITNYTGLQFSVRVAADEDPDWETLTDYIKFYYEIDGGGVNQLLWFYPNSGDNFLRQDADFNQIGEGTALTATSNVFSENITGTGSSLTLTFEAQSRGNGEEFAIDDVVLSSVLPVELTFFNAQNKGEYNFLSWQTASESNNEGFNVEHSLDGLKWQDLDFVEGNGTSFVLNNYEYIHERPTMGINYYRLKQTDFDGAFEYSKVIAIEFGSSDRSIQVFPNPSNRNINIQIDNPLSQIMKIVINDNLGRKIWESELIEGESNWRKEMEIDGNGIYFITAQIGNKTFYERVIIFR